MHRIAFVLAVAACASVPDPPAADEIYAWEVERPAGARPGMFVTYRFEESDPSPDDVVEKTVACVRPDTMEWRERRRDGAETVIAARYHADGTLAGAWRGPAGGVGAPLRVRPNDVDVAEATAEADRRGRALGISTRSAKSEQEYAEETIETPAGRFRCAVHRVKVSLLVASGTTTAWIALDALPLARLVRFEQKGPLSYFSREELVAYGESGAAPTLETPEG